MPITHVKGTKVTIDTLEDVHALMNSLNKA